MVVVSQPSNANGVISKIARRILVIRNVFMLIVVLLTMVSFVWNLPPSHKLEELDGYAALTKDQREYRPAAFDELYFSTERGPDASAASSSVPPNQAWRPSSAWIRNCSADLRKKQAPLGYWNVTRAAAIGDCIKFCRCKVTTSNQKPHPVNSFNALYYARACFFEGGFVRSEALVPGGNLTLVGEIQEQQAKLQPALFVSPSPDAVVIHLRLGDVLEKAAASVEEMLQEGTEPGVGSSRSFPKGIKSIWEFLQSLQDHGSHVRSVHVIGGNHRPQFFRKSRIYAGCVARALQTAGYTRTLRLEGVDPDVDFYYVSHARSLIVSAGSFSNLMGRLVTQRGGKILGRSFGIDWN